jgi:hypothetical protein
VSPASKAARDAARLYMNLRQLPPARLTPEIVAAQAEIAAATECVLADDLEEDREAVARLLRALSAAEPLLATALSAAPAPQPAIHPLALAALRAESDEERKRAEINARGEGWGANEYVEFRPFEAVRIAHRKAWAAAGFPFEA